MLIISIELYTGIVSLLCTVQVAECKVYISDFVQGLGVSSV